MSYETLQQKISSQKEQIATQRETISQQKIAGERGIQSLKKVHPRADPSVWEGRKPRIESIKSQLGELGEAEKELDISEGKLLQQEKLLAERKKEGWQIKETDGGQYVFYKTEHVAPAPSDGAPRGDFTMRVRYRYPGETKDRSSRMPASRLEYHIGEIESRGGTVIQVESLGGGRWLRDDPAFITRTTTGGSFTIEAVPIKKKRIDYGPLPSIEQLKFMTETVPEKHPELQYLLTYADPPQQRLLQRAITSRFPEKVREVQFQLASQAAYKSLTSTERTEYGFLFQPFKEEPVSEWKYYPGGVKYLESLPPEEKKKILEEFDVKTDIPEDVSILAYSHRAAEIYKGLESKAGKLSFKEKGELLREAKEQAEWEILTKKPREFKEITFAGLPWFERIQQSTFQAMASFATYPITLTQLGVKYVRGTGALTDPMGRIRTGETLTGYDVAKYQEKVRLGPLDIISIRVTEAISYMGGEEYKEYVRREKEYAEKYPIETLFATGGAIFGLWVGGQIIHGGKVTVGKAITEMKAPIVKGLSTRTVPPGLQWTPRGIAGKLYGRVQGTDISAYYPGALLRKGYWKVKTVIGRAKYVPEEQVWHPQVLSGVTRYAKAKDVQEMIRFFKEAKTPEGYVGIHATPYKFRIITSVPKGTSETPGISVSAFGKGSPHFLKIGSDQYQGYFARLSLLPKFKRPTAPLVVFKELYRLPKNLRHFKPGETLQQYYIRVGSYLTKQPRGTYATIAAKAEIGAGPEIEAIVTGGTWMFRRQSYFWTTYKGHAIPLPKFLPLGEGKPTGAMLITSWIPEGVKDFFAISSYTGEPAVSLVSPFYIASKAFLPSYASVPSKPSMPSFPSVPSMPSMPSISSIISRLSMPSIPSRAFSKLVSVIMHSILSPCTSTEMDVPLDSIQVPYIS